MSKNIKDIAITVIHDGDFVEPGKVITLTFQQAVDLFILAYGLGQAAGSNNE